MFARTNLSNAEYLSEWDVSNGEDFSYMFESIGQAVLTYREDGTLMGLSMDSASDFSQFQADLSSVRRLLITIFFHALTMTQK